jgi:hypothetical protein
MTGADPSKHIVTAREDSALAIALMLSERAKALRQLGPKFEKASEELFLAAEDIRAGKWKQYMADVPFMRPRPEVGQ